MRHSSQQGKSPRSCIKLKDYLRTAPISKPLNLCFIGFPDLYESGYINFFRQYWNINNIIRFKEHQDIWVEDIPQLHADVIIINVNFSEWNTLEEIQTSFRTIDYILSFPKGLVPPLFFLGEILIPLVRKKSSLNALANGVGSATYSTPLQDIRALMEMLLQGQSIWPSELNVYVPKRHLKPIHKTILELKFMKGFKNSAISQTCYLSERSIRNYYNDCKEAFRIQEHEAQDLDIQVRNASMQLGYIR